MTSPEIPLVEERIENPEIPLTSSRILSYVGGLGDSAAGVTVNDRTSMSAAAVFSAVSVLARTVGALPVDVFRKTDKGREPVGAKDPVAMLFDLEPNPAMTPQVFVEAVTARMVLNGTGYAYIGRDNAGNVRSLWPIDPANVERHDDGTTFSIHSPGRSATKVNAAELLVLPGFTTDGITGLAPILSAPGAIGLTIAAERFGASFFANGATVGGVLEAPTALSDQAIRNLSASFASRHQGPDAAHKTAVLEQGVSWKSTSTPPDSAQFLETRQFQTTEIARLFGVPPHMIGDLSHATFSNIEHQSLDFVRHSLVPLLTRWEQEIRRKLLRKRPSYFVKFNVNSLLRGDMTTRATFYAQLWNIGAISSAEIRTLEDLPPGPPELETYRIPLNTAPAGQAEVDDQAQNGAPSDGEPSSDRARLDASLLEPSLRGWLVEAAGRAVSADADRIRRRAKRHLPEDRKAFQDWLVTYADEQRERLPHIIGHAAAGYADTLAAAEGREAAPAPSVVEQAIDWYIVQVSNALRFNDPDLDTTLTRITTLRQSLPVHLAATIADQLQQDPRT